MHFSNVAAVLSLLGLVSAAPLAARSAADVEKDITTVQGEVDKLDGDIKAFTGSIIQALGLLSDFNSLKSSIDTATTDATNAGTLSAGDSDTIYGDLNTLSGHISTTLNDGIAQVRASASHFLHLLTLSRPPLSRMPATEARSTTPFKLFRLVATFILMGKILTQRRAKLTAFSPSSKRTVGASFPLHVHWLNRVR